MVFVVWAKIQISEPESGAEILLVTISCQSNLGKRGTQALQFVRECDAVGG